MGARIIRGKLEEVMPTLEPESFDLIHADPPYYRVLGEAWDRQWPTREAFLSWLGTILDGFSRLLKPSGSLYVWCSHQSAAAVEELVVRPRFEVLSSITWDKSARPPAYGLPTRQQNGAWSPEEARVWHNVTERCIFAGVKGAEHQTKQGTYGRQEATLWAQVSEPLRAYLIRERDAAGLKNRDVDAFLGTNGMAGHYFGASQWNLPTEDAYRKIQEHCRGHFLRPWSSMRKEQNGLRQEFEGLRQEGLRQEFEELRRPFRATGTDATNVWKHAPAPLEPGRHPAEKPVPMMVDIVRTSTREGARVLDAFAGSGAMSAACIDEGRDVVAVEDSATWCADIKRRNALHEAAKGGEMPPLEMRPITGPLFDEEGRG
jgi:site-specific DNA-methyltransferase (adenine-specific)